MRLFTAIDIPKEVIRTLEQLSLGLRPTARIHWSPIQNLHITTKFVGEWPDAKVPQLQDALTTIGRHAAFPAAVRGLGFFPNARSPRVFWAGVEAPPALADLARQTELALNRAGVPEEGRPFSPHLTLARIKEPVPLDKLHSAIAALPSREFGEFTVDRFYLYQSRLTQSGSIYTKLSEYRLESR